MKAFPFGEGAPTHEVRQGRMRLPQYEFSAVHQKSIHRTAPHPALRATLPKGEGM